MIRLLSSSHHSVPWVVVSVVDTTTGGMPIIRSLPHWLSLFGIGGSELADASAQSSIGWFGSLARVGLDPSVLDPNNELRPVGSSFCSLICWQLITGYDGLLNRYLQGTGTIHWTRRNAGERDWSTRTLHRRLPMISGRWNISPMIWTASCMRTQGQRIVLVAHSMGAGCVVVGFPE